MYVRPDRDVRRCQHEQPERGTKGRQRGVEGGRRDETEREKGGAGRCWNEGKEEDRKTNTERTQTQIEKGETDTRISSGRRDGRARTGGRRKKGMDEWVGVGETERKERGELDGAEAKR